MPDFLNADYWLAHRLELSYAAAAFVLFLAFLFATFPYTPAVKAALAPMGLRFESSGQGFALPFGARLDKVRIQQLVPGAPPLFESESVRVSPALFSTLLFHPGINLSAKAYSGNLKLHVHRRGEGAAVSFDADKLDLASIGLLRQFGAALGGELSGDGDITFDPLSPTGDDGAAVLHAKGLLVRIPWPTGAIGLGDVELILSLEHGVVKIGTIKASGGDLAIDGRGSIQLDPDDWQESRLALQFTLTPSPTARQRLEFLLNFLPHPPGTGPYKLGGTVSSPAFS